MSGPATPEDDGAHAVAGRPQSLYLHIGVPKSGTTYLQALIANNRGLMKAAGFIYPFVRRECMFHAAVEIRQQHERWGLSHEFIDGTWDTLLAKVRAFDGDGLISHEILAGAMPPQIARVARDAEGLDLHIVVTARDLARQATAHWQEQVKNGRRWSFKVFQRELFEESESENDEVGFWRSQDLVSVLTRWSAIVPADHVHVVTVPRSGTDPEELWRRFADALGVDPGAVDLSVSPRSNESLGAPQIQLLRRVVIALDHRLTQPHYAHVVKRFFSQVLLSRIDSRRAIAPRDLCEQLDVTALEVVEHIEKAGYRVHGDLQELRPVLPTEDTPHPDDVTAEEMLEGLPDVLADIMLELATLRGQVTGPKGLPPFPPDADQPAAAPAAAEQGHVAAENEEPAEASGRWDRVRRWGGRRHPSA